MRIVFFGTPQFATKILERILFDENDVLAVVTTPDVEKGRGLKVGISDVKKFALEKKIKVLQPTSLKDTLFIEELAKLNADLFVVVAFRILPKQVFQLPKYGTFNLHGSLLPKFRGAAPIQWAIIKGEKITGVTTFKLAEKVDTGNIFLQKSIEIDESDNFGSLHDKLIEIGQDLVAETISLIESGNFNLKEQNDELSTPAPKIKKEDCKIDWMKSAEEINNLIKGLSPYPGAFFVNNEKIVKVYKAEIVKNFIIDTKHISQTKNELIIGCGKDALRILELQLEGKKRMGIDEFLRGYRFEKEYIYETKNNN